MNYIEQIKGFWRSHDVESFPVDVIALYFYLLEVNNKASWIVSFKRNNAKICADLSISYPTLCKARNKLKQSGLIDFTTQNGNANVSYSLKNFLKVCNEVSDEVCNEVDDEVCLSKDKLKHKLISIEEKQEKVNPVTNPPEEKRKKVPPKKEKPASFEIKIPFGETFVAVWSAWKQYKELEFKFRYKSPQSEQAAMNELFNLSKGNQQTAEAIIQQSMAKGWKGFFELKNFIQNANNRQNPAKGTTKNFDNANYSAAL